MSVHRLTRDELLEYRAERGWTAISIEICPHDPVTAILPDDELDNGLRLFEDTVVSSGVDGSREDRVAGYAGTRQIMAERLVPAVATFNRREIENCAIVALWCALHHPSDGGLLQARMMHIRSCGAAPHFTICRGPLGAYGTALGEGYADLRSQLAGGIDPRHTIIGVR
jgi:hypothetical protein